MADDKIIIEFDGDIKKLQAKLKSSQKEASKLSKIGSGIDKAISASAKTAAVGIGAITVAIGGAINEAAKFESITTQFEVLTGSASKARDVVKEIQEFSASTPFQFEGISTAAQQLLGFGFAADEIVPKLQQIGDVASAVGRPIEEVGFIFGQVAAAGKLTGERLLQFQERAIPIGPAIAKTLGVAESAVKDLVSQGKVDFKTFEQAFQSLSSEGGFAFQGMIKQSKTFGGVVSTVKDNVSLLAADIGNELLPAAKNLATAFLGVLQGLRKTDNFITTAVKFWGKTIADQFDQSSTGTKKNLDELNKDLAEVNKRIAEIDASRERNKNNPIYNVALIGRAKQDLQELGNALAEQTQLRKQIAEQERLLDQQRAEEKAEQRALELEKEKEQAELLRQQKLDSLTEEELAILEATEERREREREALRAHQEELEKIEKTRITSVEQAKRKIAQEDLKAQVKENNLRLKEEQRYGKTEAQARAFFRSQERQAAEQALNALITLGQTGNKKLVAIAKAASVAKAIMNTAEGVTKALAFGPILGPALAATIGAAGAVQIATISGVKFADGGMITGGLAGIDSVPAIVQQGEVVVPKKNFEEVIGSVRAQRAAENITTGGNGSTTSVEISFNDNIGEFIEAQIIERRETGVGSI